MSSRQLDEERIFRVARDIPNPNTRAEYLDQICAGDQALHDRIGVLLNAHQQTKAFLIAGQPEPVPTVHALRPRNALV